MKKFIGIDQSYTSSGYCVVDESGAVIDFGTYKTDSSLDMYDRALDVAMFVLDKVREHKAVSFNIEGLAFGIRGDATRDLAGLLFTIVTHLRAADRCISSTVIPPTQLKKFATGSGKADKKAMMEAVPEHVINVFKDAGYKKTTGLADICDAYWLARMSKV